MKSFLQKTDALEDKFLSLLYRFRLPVFVVLVTILTFWARTFFWPFVSADYTEFLHNWLNEIRSLLGFHSLGTHIGNYTAPYHYLLAAFTYIPGLDNLLLIKITSSLADYAMAAGGAMVLWQITKSPWKAACCYAVLLCLPTVFLNSAAWGQCDAMYTAVVLWCLFFWVKQKKSVALALYGIALAVKLQAIFVLPAFLIFWLCGRLRVRHLLAMAGGYVLAFVPAILASGSLYCLIAAYQMQTVVHTLAPNIYNGLVLFWGFDQETVYMVSTGLVLFALVLVGALAYYCWQKRDHFSASAEFLLILLLLCLVPYSMPGMRERYFYMAEAATVLYGFIRPSRFVLPLCLQLATLPSYMQYLTGFENPFGPWLMVLMGLPILVLSWDLYKNLKNGPTTQEYPNVQAVSSFPSTPG